MTAEPAEAAPTRTPAAMGAPMSRTQRVTYVVLRFLLGLVTKVWFRWTVVGRENLPASGAFIVSPIHRSFLDTPMLAVTSKRILRFMGKESLWTNAFGAWFLTSMGGFPVERGTADRAAMRAARAVLDRGEPLVMFPEGTRRTGAVLLAENMHEGPSFMAGRARVPIVPVGIGGSERILPAGTKIPKPRKLTFVIGTPIPPPEEVDGRVSRRAVREHAELVRGRIQELFDEAQIRAGA